MKTALVALTILMSAPSFAIDKNDAEVINNYFNQKSNLINNIHIKSTTMEELSDLFHNYVVRGFPIASYTVSFEYDKLKIECANVVINKTNQEKPDLSFSQCSVKNLGSDL